MTNDNLVLLIEQPKSVTRDGGFSVGCLTGLTLHAWKGGDGRWHGTATQNEPKSDPDPYNTRTFDFVVTKMRVTPTKNHIFVRLKEGTAVPHGFFWDDKRHRVDKVYGPHDYSNKQAVGSAPKPLRAYKVRKKRV